MTAASPTTARPARNPSGLWTFLRLLGGWFTVAALAYLLWMPGEDFGWLKMMFVWVLLTLLADEFAGWFGYIGLALGILPFLYAGTPEQWFVVFPLLGGALFALLIMKHSGGPFVLPFGAALYVGVILAAARFGAQLDPELKLPASRNFQEMAILPMLVVMSFSFVRQLGATLWRWNVRRTEAKSLKASSGTASKAATPTPAEQTPLPTSPAALPNQSAAPVPTVPALNPGAVNPGAANPAVNPAASADMPSAGVINPATTIIDMDLEDLNPSDPSGPHRNT